MALMAESPAIDAAATEQGQCRFTVDQRGASRPQDGDGDGRALCNIGAFELRPQQGRIFLPLAVR